MKKAIRKYAPIKYDASSIFVQNFCEKVLNEPNFYSIFRNLESELENGYHFNQTEFRIDPFNLTITTKNYSILFSPSKTDLTLEEICDHFDHSPVFTIDNVL